MSEPGSGWYDARQRIEMLASKGNQPDRFDGIVIETETYFLDVSMLLQEIDRLRAGIVSDGRLRAAALPPGTPARGEILTEAEQIDEWRRIAVDSMARVDELEEALRQIEQWESHVAPEQIRRIARAALLSAGAEGEPPA